MGVICPACGTENRSVAKFCIECIGSLPTNFATIEILPDLPDPPPAAHSFTFVREPDIPAYATLPHRSGFVAARGMASGGTAAQAAEHSAQMPAMSSGLYRTVERRKGLWVSVAAFAIALVVGAAGWMVAGAGGLYIYAFGHSGAGGEPRVSLVTASAEVAATVLPTVVSLLPPAPIETLAAPPAAAVAVSTNMAASQSSVMSPATSGASSAVRPTAKPTASSAAPVRLPIATDAATAATTAIATTGTTATTTVTPVTTARDPNGQCTGLGFFAASRCMAAQCAKSEYSAHSACTAVRQQQRLMEEKRNPTMAN